MSGKVTFPQPCLKVVKKIYNNMTFVWYVVLILQHLKLVILYLSYPKKFPKVAFERFRKMKNAKTTAPFRYSVHFLKNSFSKKVL